MSDSRCLQCDGHFDATRHPICPRCLVEGWLATERFVREKHDPRRLPMTWEGYRSVLNPNLVSNPRPYLEDAVARGRWYHDRFYGMYVFFCPEPLGVHPGSGIPEGAGEPEHSLDCLLVAEADSKSEAHAFAVSRAVFDKQIEAGEFVPLSCCEREGCGALQLPGRATCIDHQGGENA